MVKVKEYQYEFSIQRKQWRRMNKIKKIFNYEGN